MTDFSAILKATKPHMYFSNGCWWLDVNPWLWKRRTILELSLDWKMYSLYSSRNMENHR